MAESLQHKLDRVRPPRVQITYDVEIGDAIQIKELPFVMGILADLAGMPAEALPRVKERKFVEIDRDNFNLYLAAVRPRLTYRVANKLAADPAETSVELFFEDMEDFQPVRVVNQIPALAKLYNSRVRLKDLITKMDGNDLLAELLLEIINDPKKLKEVKDELGKMASAEAAG